MSDQVAPICGEDQLQLKRKNSWYSILDASGGENNSVHTYPNYNMQMDSIREPSADTYSSWSSEQSIGYDDFSFQDSGNWSTSPKWRIRQFGFDGFDGAVSSGETQRFSYDNQQQQVVGTGLGNFSGTTGPLGLILTKTPSFLELVESQIFKKYNTASTDESSDESKKQERKKGETEKIKASKIMALGLRIGCFERASKNDEDVVTKCHYARQKLLWEILHRALKYKIEIKWSEISVIRAVFPKNQPSKLEIQDALHPILRRRARKALRETAAISDGKRKSSHRAAASICLSRSSSIGKKELEEVYALRSHGRRKR
ncbi:hypothetical protein Syun_021946 [Stephania yunnanensis]|uniref:TRF2/HOY1 PH-like domain-containing protein n=1 Tax=Stephania yunnanensis TaxID=152371 RepID=A0AAP0NR48_9MAGN